MTKRSFLLAIVLGTVGIARGSRPLIVDDAGVIDWKTWQLEIGTSYNKSDDTRRFDLPVALHYGPLPRLEIFATFGGSVLDPPDGASIGGADDLLLSAKWNVLDQDKDHAAAMLTLAGDLKLPTADSGRMLGTGQTDGDFGLIITRKWSQTSVDADLKFGISGEGSDFFFYGLAVHRGLPQISDKLTLVGEVFAQTPISGPTALQSDIGVQYALRDNVTLDTAVGTGLNHFGPDLFVTFGITLNF